MPLDSRSTPFEDTWDDSKTWERVSARLNRRITRFLDEHLPESLAPRVVVDLLAGSTTHRVLPERLLRHAQDVHLVDGSPAMLARGAKQLQQHHRQMQVHTHAHHLHSGRLPELPQPADLLTCSLGLRYLDARTPVAAAQAWLAPGGLLTLVDGENTLGELGEVGPVNFGGLARQLQTAGFELLTLEEISLGHRWLASLQFGAAPLRGLIARKDNHAAKRR